MAGFEGPSDPDGDDGGATKLPSWAVTRKDAEPDLGPAESVGTGGFADVGATPDAVRNQRTAPPVSRVPEHPFDVDDPFGDKQLGGVSSPWIRPPADDTEIRVVDLADEFHLTTAQALEVCEAAGAPASSGAAWLTADQAEAFRAAVADYDRSASSDESFPDWAIPPGGRPATQSAAPDGPSPRASVPGTTAGVDAVPAEGTAPATAPPSTRAGLIRILVLVVLVVAVLAVVAVILTR